MSGLCRKHPSMLHLNNPCSFAMTEKLTGAGYEKPIK